MDSCVYLQTKPFLVLALYVDDVIIVAESEHVIHLLIERIREKFDVHLMESQRFLGFQYYQNDQGDIVIHQKNYLTEVLEKLDMWNCYPALVPVSPNEKESGATKLKDNDKFRSAVGALQYAACQTRPDIAYAVGLLSRNVIEPTTFHWQVLRTTLCYIRGTLELGLCYRSNGKVAVTVYSDADFAGDVRKYRSTSGHLILVNGSPIGWKSKLQRTTVTDTTEAEFMAVSAAIKAVIPIRSLGQQLEVIDDQPLPLLCDNKGTVLITSNECSVQRTRNLGAQLHYAREHHQGGTVRIEHVKGEHQLADILTKATTRGKFERNRNLLMTLVCYITSLFFLFLPSLATNYDLIRSRDIVWAPTKYTVYSGLTDLSLEVQIHNFCDLYTNVITNSSSLGVKEILGRLADTCQVTRNKTVVKTLREIEIIQNMKRRLPRDASDGTLFWASVWFPPVQAIYQKYNPDSAYNTVWKNVKRLDNIEAMLEVHKIEFDKIISINGNNTLALTSMINIVNQTVEEQRVIQEMVPTLLEASNIVNTNNQRQAESLIQLKHGLQKSKVDMAAVNKLRGQRSELIISENMLPLKAMEVDVTNARIDVTFNHRVSDNSSTVYKSYIFKRWINELTFEVSMDKLYALYNATSNCSTLIQEPMSERVYDTCEFVNQSIASTGWTELDWKTMHFTKSEKYNSTEPMLVELEECFAIQCYQNNISINGAEQKCEKDPFIMPKNISFQVRNTRYSYDMQKAPLGEEENQINMKIVLSQSKHPFNKIMNYIENMKEENNMIRDLNTLTFDKISNSVMEYPIVWTLGAGSTGILVLFGMIIYCLCKKDPIVQAVQAQILSNVTDRCSVRSLPASFSPNSTSPNIKISINTGVSAIPPPRPPAYEDMLYPELHQTVPEDILYKHRPPTPFAGKANSSNYSDTSGMDGRSGWSFPSFKSSNSGSINVAVKENIRPKVTFGKSTLVARVPSARSLCDQVFRSRGSVVQCSEAP